MADPSVFALFLRGKSPIIAYVRAVNLTKVKSNRRELKKGLVESVRGCIDQYDTVYVFAYESMRTSMFQELRADWTDSRFFMGKNKVLQKAFCETVDDEYRPNLGALAADISGNVGLLFTNKPHDEVTAFFATYAQPDYARSGAKVNKTVTIEKGVLDTPHTMTETLRKLGMPVRLDKGKVVLESDYTICKAGDNITPEQGRLLKHFDHLLATFRFHLMSMWERESQKYTALATSPPQGFASGEGEDDEMDGEESDE